MLESGPWLIHNVPLILQKCFTEDGLSVTATLMLDTYTTSMFMESWSWSNFARTMSDLHADVELKDTFVMAVFGHSLEQCLKKTITDVNVKTQRQVVRDLRVGPKYPHCPQPVQTMNFKKIDNRQANYKDTNSKKVSSNNNSSSKSMVDVASSSGTKIMTLNPFDVLNMVDKYIGVLPSDSINSKNNDVNVGNSKYVNLYNDHNDRENKVEDDDNETASFMASKSSKGIGSSKSKCEAGKTSLYEHWKDDYDDNPYDDDEECEDMKEDKLAFYDAFDISLHCQIRRWLCLVEFLVKCTLEDVFIVFFAQFLNINPRSGVGFSWVACRFHDGCHEGSCIYHYMFFFRVTSSTGSHGWRQLVDTKVRAAWLTRKECSTGSHGWRQLVDTKVRAAWLTRKECSTGSHGWCQFVRDPAQRKTPLVLPWERIPRLDSGVRIRICYGE
nr:hypothetical protein [Tanacetum cinerariifolium]